VVLRHDVKFFDEDELSSEDNKQIVDDFKQGVLNLCQENMGKFFRDKNLHTGGKIPNSLLSNKRRISMVLNYTNFLKVNISKTITDSYINITSNIRILKYYLIIILLNTYIEI
jgi:hypothetical protein